MHSLEEETVGVILAGGKGTRLGALTRHRCKPAVHFGGACRSIDFTLSNCVNSGVRRVGVATQYRAHSLIRHLHRHWRPTMPGNTLEIWPAEQQQGHYLGTADAVYQNLGHLERLRPRYILILAADHVYRMHYGDLLEVHQQARADLTVACLPVPVEQARQFGIVSVEGQRVTDFVEKPQHLDADRNPLASMGIYLFNADFLRDQLRADAARPKSAHDFGRDILPACVHAPGVRVCAWEFRDPCTGGAGYWRDIGTIDAYWSASMELLDPGSGADPYDPRWPVWTLPDRVAPVRMMPAVHGLATTVSGAVIGNGCRLDGAAVSRSILSEGVHVGPGSVIEDSVLLPGARVGRGCWLRRTIVDEGVVVPDGACLAEGRMPAEGLYETSDGGITVFYGFRHQGTGTRARRTSAAGAARSPRSAGVAATQEPPPNGVGGIA